MEDRTGRDRALDRAFECAGSDGMRSFLEELEDGARDAPRRCPKAAAILEEAECDALVYLQFPRSHWKRLRTNNLQERTNREIKRRSRVVQVFPSAESLERLTGAVMCDQDEAWSDKRYFSEAKIAELCDEGLRKRERQAKDEMSEEEVRKTARNLNKRDGKPGDVELEQLLL